MSRSDLFIPDAVVAPEAYARCSHMGIGAHQDDLEFMAFHGISSCYDNDGLWFGGITCTDGGGSSRTGKYADTSDEEMQRIRAEEQRSAATIGQYSLSSSSVSAAQRSKIRSNAAPSSIKSNASCCNHSRNCSTPTTPPINMPPMLPSFWRSSKPSVASPSTRAQRKSTAAKSGATSTGSARRIKSHSTSATPSWPSNSTPASTHRLPEAKTTARPSSAVAKPTPPFTTHMPATSSTNSGLPWI